jgi:hypothetical protein
MPTREVLASFWYDWHRLTPRQQRAFRQTVAQFIADVAGGGQSFHPRLRVKRAQGHPGIWEMTWAPDGRATFEYGDEIRPGEPGLAGAAHIKDFEVARLSEYDPLGQRFIATRTHTALSSLVWFLWDRVGW